MFNLSDILNTLDNAAKESLEDEKVSATYIRSQRKGDSSVDIAKTPFSAGHGTALGTSHLAVSDDVCTPHLSTYNKAQPVSDNVRLSASNDPIDNLATASHARVSDLDSRENKEVLKEDASDNMTSSNLKTEESSTVDTFTAKSAVDVHKPVATIPEENTRDTRPAPSNSSTKNVAALELEIERLNSECLELEDQVANLKREGEDAWSSYQRAQSTASNRETELLEEINTLKKSKTDLSNSNAQLQSKANTDLEDILSQLKEVQGEKEETVNRMKSMTLEMEGKEKLWKETEESLLTELSVAKTTGVQGSEDLKVELRTALDAANTLRMEHKSLVHQAHQREKGLEESNAELSLLVANLQRELTNAKSSTSNDNDHIDPILGAASGGQMAEDRQLDVLYASIQAKSEELSRCKESLSTLDHTVNALRKENSNNEERRREEVENMQDQMNRYKSTITTLEGQLKEAKKASAYSNNGVNRGLMRPFGNDDNDDHEEGEEDMATLRQSNKQLREQAQSVSKQLLRKQQMVLELQAERSALKSRLQDAMGDLETKTRELRESGGGAYSPYGFGDEEEGGGFYPPSNQSTGLTKRGGTGSDTSPGTASKSQQGKMVRELERYGMKAPMPVAKAVDAIDSWTLVTGRYMKAYPLIRIGVVFYLVFLHIWVFFVLSLHASSMEGAPHQAEIGDFVTNNIEKRPHISGGGLGPG